MSDEEISKYLKKILRNYKKIERIEQKFKQTKKKIRKFEVQFDFTIRKSTKVRVTIKSPKQLKKQIEYIKELKEVLDEFYC